MNSGHICNKLILMIKFEDFAQLIHGRITVCSSHNAIVGVRRIANDVVLLYIFDYKTEFVFFSSKIIPKI